MVDQTSQFYAILTDVGAAKQANADALGIAWTFSQMGVGDGNPTGLDNPALPMPNSSQKALLNEWRRAPLNQLKVDPNNAAVIIAEQIIPADVGGKWIREIALYDSDGDMVAVANCPPTFKPLMSQGSGRTQVLRLNLLVTSASNVQLKIDPSVVLATREWVTEELARQDFKYSVLAATTAPITLSGLQTVDGVSLTAGARVLVKNQAAGKDNGLYLVVASGVWKRCADADTSSKVTPGLLVLVERGTLNGDSAWQLVTDATITLGVTALVFEMAFGRTGVAAGTYRSVTVDAYGRVTAASNPTTVAGYGLTDVYTKAQIDQALALKAPLESPNFTGDPKVPTVAATDNDTSAASTAFVRSAMALFGIGGSSPVVSGSLDSIEYGGLYSVGSTTVGGLPTVTPAVPQGSQVLHMSYTDGPSRSEVQLLIDRIYDRLFFRRCDSGAWKAWVPIWNGADTPKQTSATDVSTGAMLQVGSFGLGNAMSTGEVDMNKYLIAGNYITPIAGLINLPEGWANNRRYNMVVGGVTYAGMYLTQTLTTVMSTAGSVPLQAVRSMSGAGEFSAWRIEAPLDSPVFTGDPRTPTPAVDDNDTSIANTAFVMRALGSAGFGPQSTAYSLGVGVDLNTMKGGGSYGQASNGNATLALNYPVPLAGTLLVLTAGTSVVTQIYTVRGTGLSYIRSFYATWSAWALIWDASNTPKQSNLTDKTSGAMLTVGSFGVGAGLLSTEKDMNNYVIPGNYTTPIVGLLNLPEGWPVTHRYVVVVEGFSNENYLIQRITGGLANGHAPLYAKRTMSSSGTWTPWRDEWHSGNTPKQTSPTDITPGAMLTVGSFGWGGSAVAFSGDIDALAVSGIYMIGTTTTGTKPENAGAVSPNGSLLHIERGSSRMATQFWDSLISSTSPMSFIRTKNSSGVWSAWELVITEKHLPCRAKVYYKSAGVYQWTVPAGVYKVDVEVRGAGGSGGFNTQDNGANGGGGGGISKRLCTVVPGSVITVTVGAGGASVSTVGAGGNAGTASSFGVFCSATGGGGGGVTAAAGGSGSGGEFNASMGPGSPAVRNAGGTYALGGAGGGGESIPATSHYTVPTQPGMGGGGRTSNQSQPGADGCVFITY